MAPYVSSTGSPMYYTAKIAKKKHPDAKIVFVGPCLAKKKEVRDNPDTDIAITFEEIGSVFAGLHIDFETIDGAPESYAPNVLTASDSLYRFIHEFQPHKWERVDMRKVGTIIPDKEALLRHNVSKRKGGEPIFLD